MKGACRGTGEAMKSGTVVGPDDIPVEVWSCIGQRAVDLLTKFFNVILHDLVMPA